MRISPLFAGVALALSSSVALAATQTITVFDGTAVTPIPNPAHPKVAVDTDNRSHIVWVQDATEGTGTRYNVFYKLIAADGSTLIDATQLSGSTDGSDDRKPQIAVTGTDFVYVAWHNGGSDSVRMIGIDPSKDDLNGNAASLATIQRFTEQTGFTSAETGGSSTRHPYIDVDSTGKAHILLLDGISAYCAVYNADGTVATAPTQVVDLAEVRGGGAAIALDENDKMHIAVAYNGTSTKEIAYSMVDCAAGTRLIDATIISTDDTMPSMQPSLAYDAGAVYISWIDTACGESNGGNYGTCAIASNIVQFIALDPSKDDQNGNAASLAAITKVATKSVAVPATVETAFYPRMSVIETGDLQILYYTSSAPDNLYGTIVDANGDVVSAAAEIMNDTSTAEPTGQTKASVDNRATVYPEAQKIMLSLRDIVPPAAVPAPAVPVASSGSSGFSLSLWSLFGLSALTGLLRLRRK